MQPIDQMRHGNETRLLDVNTLAEERWCALLIVKNQVVKMTDL